MRGKKIRCKTCGTVARASDQVEGGSQSSAGLSVDDLYGLSDGPASAPVAIKRAAAPPHGGQLELPQSPIKQPRSKSRAKSWRPEDVMKDELFSRGASIFFGGMIAFAMPFFGVVLADRFGRHGLPPRLQEVIGLVAMLIGLVMMIAGILRAVPNGLAKLAMSCVAMVPMLGAIGTAVCVPLPQCPPANGPNPPAAGQPGAGLANLFKGAGAAPAVEQARFNSPADSVRITLSGGKYRSRTMALGQPLPGVEVEVNYVVNEGMAVGSKFSLVIESRTTKGKLTTFHLMPSGSISAMDPVGNVNEGPFEAHVEAESFDGRVTKVVSNTITLQRDEPANAGAPAFPGQFPGSGPFPPAANQPPQMPGRRGFPAGQPGRPRFGGRGMGP